MTATPPDLTQILHQYRHGSRGLPNYDELTVIEQKMADQGRRLAKLQDQVRQLSTHIKLAELHIQACLA